MSDERLELEAAIVGSIAGGGCKDIGLLFTELSEEDFSDSLCKAVFAAELRLFHKSVNIDRISLVHELGDDEYSPFLAACIGKQAGNAADYARILKERAKLDSLRAEASALQLATNLGDATAAVEAINGLMVARKTIKSRSMADVAQSFSTRHSTSKKPDYLRFGFPKLDKMLYTEPGDFVVVAGEPSAGKTALATQMAVTLAAKKRVGFFTLETSIDKIEDRIYCQQTRIPMAKIKENNLTEPEWHSIAEASENIFKLQMEIVHASGWTVSDIQSYSLAKRFEVVFIDYLQIIQSPRSRRAAGRYEQVTEISMALHAMAQTHGITVVALAQLSRPEKKKNGRPDPPSMHDLRESGQIEQDADSILLIYRLNPNDNGGARVLKVGKNKDGDWAEFTLDFDGPTQFFSESRYQPRPRQSEPKKQAAQTAMDGFEELGDSEPLPF